MFRIASAVLALLLALGFATPAKAAIEIFAKGSVSKNNISQDTNTISVSATTGFALTIIPRVRLEARFTNVSSLQNKLEIRGAAAVGTINDLKTQTTIYSLGLDIDILGKKSAFQPFIFVGAGYLRTERSYYFTLAGAADSTYQEEPRQTGISGNLGAGFRIQLASSFAFEVEVFGYATDIDKPNYLVNLYGTVGFRLFM
jgi:hypothetical protein